MKEVTQSPISRQLSVEKLHSLLETEIIGVGDHVVYVPIVDSTNTIAMKLARSGSEEGVVVLTDTQKAGKGRQGRCWVDLVGCNVLSSTILRPLFPPYLLVMIAALAVVDAIADTCGIAASIKWPNDILIGSRKVAGILIETSRDRADRLVAILGIGVNVNGHPEQLQEVALEAQWNVTGLPERATTLEDESGHEINREAFLARLLQQIEIRYRALQEEAQGPVESAGTTARSVRALWRERLSTLGRTVQVRQGDTLLSGVAEDVNENGELLLRVHSGECISITWGDVG